MRMPLMIIALVLASLACMQPVKGAEVTTTNTAPAPTETETPAPALVATATAPATSTPLPFPQVCTGVITAQTALNLRRDPDINAELVDSAVYLLAGDTVTLHQKSGDWWLVTYSPKGDNPATTNGWANAAYIREMGCK